MVCLTSEKIHFEKLNIWGHIYQAFYRDQNIAIICGEEGRIGNLSVNLVNLNHTLKPDEFFVKLYGSSKYLNDPCFKSGLFEQIGNPFKFENDFESVWFEKWRLV